MHDIFISYSREDINQARIIANTLEQKGFSVWWDRKIPAGKSFDEVIEKAIDSSNCVIILWSSHSIKSPWARTEADEGRNRGILIPVLIEDVKIPLAFRNIQAANLINWNHKPDSPNFVSFLNDIRLLVPIGSLDQPKDSNELAPTEGTERLTEVVIEETHDVVDSNTKKCKPNNQKKKEKPIDKVEIPENYVIPKGQQTKFEVTSTKTKPYIKFGKKNINKFLMPSIVVIAVIIIIKVSLAQYEAHNKSNVLQQKKDSIDNIAQELIKIGKDTMAIRNYILDYPDGRFVNDGKELLANIQDSLNWQTALTLNTKTAFEWYLTKNPNGKHLITANEKIAELKNLKIGQQYQGGIIFYIDSTGIHGLIAATEDQATGVTWNNELYDIETGAKDSSIGGGKSNTELIVKKIGDGNYAAKICVDLVFNGYDDWFLPSRDELLKLYENRNVVGGFKQKKYFSSTEITLHSTYGGENYTNYAAYCRNFGDGKGGRYTTGAYNVRAIRSF